MSQQELIQRLAELSGMAHAIYAISESDGIDSISVHIEERLDDLVDILQAEERLASSSKFQALWPCNHQWKYVAPGEFSCCKCGERGD